MYSVVRGVWKENKRQYFKKISALVSALVVILTSLCVPFCLISFGSELQSLIELRTEVFASMFSFVPGFRYGLAQRCTALVLSKTTNHPVVFQKRCYCLTDLTTLKWQLYSTHHHNSVENPIFYVVSFIHFV